MVCTLGGTYHPVVRTLKYPSYVLPTTDDVTVMWGPVGADEDIYGPGEVISRRIPNDTTKPIIYSVYILGPFSSYVIPNWVIIIKKT